MSIIHALCNPPERRVLHDQTFQEFVNSLISSLNSSLAPVSGIFYTSYYWRYWRQSS